MFKFIIAFVITLLALGCATSSNFPDNGNDEIISGSEPTVITLKNGTPSMVKGTVRDESGVEMLGAKVMLIQNGAIITGAMTDFEGKFEINNVVSGIYDLEVNYLGYTPRLIQNVKVESSVIINFEMIKMDAPRPVSLKPIIYLYPEKETNISVRLNYIGNLTHTYPNYPTHGWSVKAQPDGTLYDENGQEYYALFWEGIPSNPITPQDGFVVSGEETVAFLEEKLAELGLNRREANEFIMFWLPQMENNPYNLIHFASEDYDAQAELQILPKPETVIRIMMITKPLASEIDFPLQDISSLKKLRKGFTVVEWGGSNWKDKVN